jgi:hypothetical protein
MRHCFHSNPFSSAAKMALGLLQPLLDSTPVLSAQALAQLLLHSALRQSSLSAVAVCSGFLFHAETARRRLKASFARWQHQRLLGDHLLRQMPWPSWLRKAPRRMAIDLHEQPYYGQKTSAIRGGQRKASTRWFWTYATLIVYHRHQVYTLACLPVEKGADLATLVEELLDRVGLVGIRVRYLLLDRGFYSAAVIERLQQKHLRFLMPVIRRGKKGSEKQKATGTQVLFEGKGNHYSVYSWEAQVRHHGKKGKRRRMSVVVACVQRKSPCSKGERIVYACSDAKWSLARIAAAYRKRFAIESTYREMHQVQALTTSKDPRHRLFLFVLGLLLVNLWVWLKTQASSQGKRNRRAKHDPREALKEFQIVLLIQLQKRLHEMNSFDANPEKTTSYGDGL